jgi:uncharacterized protein
MNDPIRRTSHRIKAGKIELDGWLYHPAQPGPAPLIIMSPGFAALRTHYLERFAERFTQAGFAVVLYDHRNFGASGGELRGEIDPHQQIADMRDVVTWAGSLPDVDAERIGVWGSSYSGGHAIVVGALDRRVRCVVSQVPTISGYQSLLRRAGERLHQVRADFERDRAARYAGEAPGRRLVCSDGDTPGIYGGDDARAFYTLPAARDAGWDNHVTLRSSELASGYEPGAWIDRVSPTPLLMLVAERDTVTPTDLALGAYARALEPKRLELLPGGHFDPYAAQADRAIQAALDWFVAHLARPSPRAA